MVSYPDHPPMPTREEIEQLKELAEKLATASTVLHSQLSKLALEYIVLATQHELLKDSVKEAFSKRYFSEEVRQYRINPESLVLNPKLNPIHKVLSK